MSCSSYKTWMFVCYLLLMIFFSLRTGSELERLLPILVFDKIIHFAEYLLLGFLLINALKDKNMKKYHWKLSLLFLFIFPFLDESLQYYTPGRTAELFDVIVDIWGGFTGASIRNIFSA